MNHEQAAQLITLLRSQLNLSQEQLAARLNVAFATINRWELGKTKPQKAHQEASLQLM